MKLSVGRHGMGALDTGLAFLIALLLASDARNPLRQVLNKRPEDIAPVFAGVHRMNAASTPYEPIMFAAIDSRFLSPEVDDLYFVPVTPANKPVGEGGPQHVDITSLAYDTTRLVLAHYVYKGETGAISYESVLAALNHRICPPSQPCAPISSSPPAASRSGSARSNDVWGWCAYFTSAADWQGSPTCLDGPDYQGHGGQPLMAWYLDQVCAYQQQPGVRPVDFLDVQYYPQGDGVDGLGGDGEDPATSARRLRALRPWPAPASLMRHLGPAAAGATRAVGPELDFGVVDQRSGRLDSPPPRLDRRPLSRARHRHLGASLGHRRRPQLRPRPRRGPRWRCSRTASNRATWAHGWR